jgi:hypothetical protein
MIDKKAIAKNKKIFEMTNEKYHVFTPKLVEFLGDNLFTAPASTMIALHNAFEGGLMDHLIRVAKYAAMLNEILPESMKCTKESILKVSFLCDIGKVFLYKPCESDWHRKNQGKIYEFIDENVSMSVGQRSLYYALSNDVMLTEDEAQSLLFFTEDGDDKTIKWHSTPLTKVLRTAIEFAIMEEKAEFNNGTGK